MDDKLIYWLIFGAIYILSRALGKKDKQKRQPVRKPQYAGRQNRTEQAPVVEPPTPAKDARTMSFEDILRELSGLPAETPKPEPVKEEPANYPELEEIARQEAKSTETPSWQVDEMDKIASRLEPAAPLGSSGPVITPVDRQKIKKELERADPYAIEEEEGVDYLSLLRQPNGAARAFVMSEIFQRKF